MTTFLATLMAFITVTVSLLSGGPLAEEMKTEQYSDPPLGTVQKENAE